MEKLFKIGVAAYISRSFPGDKGRDRVRGSE